MATNKNSDYIPPHLRRTVRDFVVLTEESDSSVSTVRSDQGAGLPPHVRGLVSATPLATNAVPKAMNFKTEPKKRDDNLQAKFDSIGSHIATATENNKRIALAAVSRTKSAALPTHLQDMTNSPISATTYVTKDSGSPNTPENQQHHSPASPDSSQGTVGPDRAQYTPSNEQDNSSNLEHESLTRKLDSLERSNAYLTIRYDNGELIISRETEELPIYVIAKAPETVRIYPMLPSADFDIEYEFDVLWPQPNGTSANANLSPISSESVGSQRDFIRSKSGSVRAQSDMVVVELDPPHTQSGWVPTQPESTFAKEESTLIRPESVLTQPESVLAQTDSGLIQEEHAIIQEESPHAQEELSFAQEELSLAQGELSLAHRESPPVNEYLWDIQAPSECLNDNEHMWVNTAPNSPTFTAQHYDEDGDLSDVASVSVVLEPSKPFNEVKSSRAPQPLNVKQTDVALVSIGEVGTITTAKAADPKVEEKIKPPNTRIYAAALQRWHDLQETESFCAGVDMQFLTKPSEDELKAKMTRKFPCINENCTVGFDTARALKMHKDECHDYCRACNLDFEDMNALHIHKLLTWEKHIVCPLCSDDFKSTGGRDRHIQQMHIRDQTITCRGCAVVFKRAGALLDHIEKNQCPNISADEFETSRAKQAYRLGKISALMITEDDRPEPPLDPGAERYAVKSALAFDEIPIDDDEAFRRAFAQKDPDDEQDKVTEKAKIPVAPVNIARSAVVPRLVKAPEPVPKTPTKKSWAAVVGQQAHPPKTVTLVQSVVVGQQASPSKTVTPVQSAVTQQVRPSTVATPIQSAKVVSEMYADSRFASLPRELATLKPDKDSVIILRDIEGNILDTKSPTFNAERFKNVLGKYKCPYPGCGKSFKGPKEFISHLESPTHKGVDSRCPYCLRNFKSPTALTQHMESPSVRCHIKESTHFDTAVSLVSGGFLEVTGRMEGGEIKYDAADPDCVKISGLV